MLVELALRGRLQLEACGVRRKSLLSRKVRTAPTCPGAALTPDPLLLFILRATKFKACGAVEYLSTQE